MKDILYIYDTFQGFMHVERHSGDFGIPFHPSLLRSSSDLTSKLIFMTQIIIRFDNSPFSISEVILHFILDKKPRLPLFEYGGSETSGEVDS